MTPKAQQATRLLIDQQDRLTRVILEDAFWCTTRSAASALAKVKRALAEPPLARELALGEFGPNGLGPLIDSICADHEFHKSLNASNRSEAA